jgi:uncharacterized glyoxalase superfamily protein PhnB
MSLEVVLWSSDVPSLAAFLARVANFEVVGQHPGYARLELGGSVLTLHADEAYEGHPWFDALKREGAARGIGAELRLEVGEVTAAYRGALAAGATVVYPPHDQEATRECQVLAPDGYLVTLWSPQPGI